MTWLQATVEMSKSLAWPGTVLIIVLIFKPQLRSLLDNLRSFEGWGMKARFRDGLERLDQKTANLPQSVSAQPEPEPEATTHQDHDPEIAHLGRVAPVAAYDRNPRDLLREGFTSVLGALALAAEFAGIPPEPYAIPALPAPLRERGVISDETAKLTSDFFETYDTRPPSINLSDALKFRDVAGRIANAIRQDAQAWVKARRGS